MPGARRIRGGIVGIIGFLLSPLSWWNDLVVNVPLALACAWVVSLFREAWFTAAFVIAYWFTNALGLVLLRKGAKDLIENGESPYSRKELLKDLAVALLYTALIIALIKLGLLRPFPEYYRSN